MQKVFLPDKNVHLSFPDSMTEQQIKNVIQTQFYGEKEKVLPKPLSQFERIGEIYGEEVEGGMQAMREFTEKPSGRTLISGGLGALRYGLSPLTAIAKGAFGEPVEQLAEDIGIPEQIGPVPVRRLIGETAEQIPYFIPYGAAVKQAMNVPKVTAKVLGKEAKGAVEQLSKIGKKPPLEYVTEPTEKLARELSATGKLAKPVVEETLQKRVADAAQITIEALPPNEKKRIGQQVIDLVHSEQINWKELPAILDKYGITAEEFAQRLKDTYSTAGRTLQRLSVVAQNVRKELSKNPEAQKFLDAFIKEMPEPSSFDKLMGAVQNLERQRRGLLVTQLATTMRNIASQGARATIGSLDDAFQGAIRATVGGEGNILKQTGEGLDTFISFYHRLTPSGRKRITQILESDSATLAKAKMFSTPVQEAVGGKIVNALNTLNRGQEYFFRKIAFESKLTQLLERSGMDIKAIDPNKISSKMLEEAAQYSLEMTFAAMPKSKFGRDLVKAWSNQPLATALLNPFPRFAFGNALPYIVNYSPISFLKAMNPRVVAELASGNPDIFAKNASRAILGTMQFGMAGWLREKHGGEKWYQLKIDDKYYDVRAYAPLLAPQMLIYEGMAHPERLNAADWVQAGLGLNRIAGSALVIPDIVRAKKIESIMKTFSQMAGEYLGSFSVPARTFDDIYSGINASENTYRDIREKPMVGPFQRNIPGWKEQLPEMISPLKTEPVKSEAPILRQLTGISQRTKTLMEKEVDRLQIDLGTIAPRTSLPQADREIVKNMGIIVEKVAPKILESKKYQNLNDAEKRLVLNKIFAEVRISARDKFAQDNPELFKKLKMEIIPQSIKDVLQSRGMMP